MAYRTNIANRLRAYGLQVVEVAGWQTRGSSYFDPKGVVAHHTASHAGRDAPALGICINGRAGLAGPLANIVLSRSGIVYVIAAGRANHAGSGGFRGLSGNSSVFGIEAENNGVGEPWGQAQLDAYYKVCAALLEDIGRDSSWVCGHKEWAPRRKIDPTGLDMNQFRANVSRASKSEPTQGVIQYNPQASFKPESGNLTIWMKGDRVSEWQAHLVKYAGQKITVDGYFGPSTHDATLNFQRFFGLAADGIVGPKTLGVMAFTKSEYYKKQNAPIARPVDPTIKRGTTGEQVKTVQKIVGVTADGVFGPKTEAAVKTYQQKLGVPQTGVWDATTRNKHSAYTTLPAYTKQPLIQKGHKGEAVKIWQNALNKYSGQRLAVDGDFGNATYLATFNFQRFFSMKADGIVGPKTWGMMDYIAKLKA